MYSVNSAATLSGYTSATFGAAQRSAFTAGMAASLSVNTSAVVIKVVTDVTSRRRLLQSSITITFKVVTTDANPSALAAKVQAQSDDESSLEQALIAGGLAITPGSLSIDPPTVGTEGEEELETLGSLETSNLTSPAQVVNVLQQIAAVTATTPQALQLAATGVAQALSNRSQVNANAITTALSVLSNVAGGTTGNTNVTLDAALSVTQALSLIVVASSSNNGTAANLTVLRQVVDVVGSLSQSLLLSAAADDPPLYISSSDIQMTLQVDTMRGPSSRLFTQALTAPGSGSSFAPLPPTLFAGGPSSSLVGVRTVFATFSFDPYSDPPDPNSTGITRLAFSSSDGDELPIKNLTTPVYFNMPRLALTDGRKAQCQFWDTAALGYGTSGCVGLPDPRPPGHVIAWKPAPNVTKDADMAAAWNINGPLVDANCSVRVLDCSLAEPGVVYPNPASPLTVPAVSCPPNTTTPMLVFSGSRCPLIQNNSLGCTWDNVKQAFVGAGCVLSGQPVQCACRHLTDFQGASRPSIPVGRLSDDLMRFLSSLRLPPHPGWSDACCADHCTHHPKLGS